MIPVHSSTDGVRVTKISEPRSKVVGSDCATMGHQYKRDDKGWRCKACGKSSKNKEKL